MSKKKRLGDLLIDCGLITKEQLATALGEQKRTNKKLGRILLDQGYVTEQDLYHVLEMQFSIPYFDLNSNYIDPMVPKLISQKLAEYHNLVPVLLKNDLLFVAMSDPLDVLAIDDITMATGYEVKPLISNEQDINKAILKYYDSTDNIQAAAKEFVEKSLTVDTDVYEETEDVANSPIVRLVNSIILTSARRKASDIHIEPYEEFTRVRIRIDGALVELMRPEKRAHSGIVTRIKIMANLNISERRIPQDGRIETVVDGMPIDMRVSLLPTVYGEKIVIRLLDRKGALLTKEQLGFSQHNLERLNKVLKIPEGIILMTGPTGSGKTTTLYTILKEYNTVDKNIITVEDPVEYRLEGINQVQVNTKAGLTFASGLRSILRQDPDIVMVGEMRDTETAQIAVRAAITGHVVLSTLHTNDTASTLARLVDMGVEAFLVATAVKGIIAQRLVRKVCKRCAESYPASDEDRAILGIPEGYKASLVRGKGCNACNNTGYSGRCGIHEVLIVDEKMQELILRGGTVDDIRAAAIASGMKTLNESCIDLVRKGLTTVDEVVRSTYQLEA